MSSRPRCAWRKAEESMQFRARVMLHGKKIVLILASVIIGLAVGGATVILHTPMYAATTQTYVSIRDVNDAEGQLGLHSNVLRPSLNTFAALVNTESVLSPVIEDLNLDTTVGDLSSEVRAIVPAGQTLVRITVSDRNPEHAAAIANATSDSLITLIGELEAVPPGTPQLVSLTTVQSAAVPEKPVSPNWAGRLIIGAVVGLVVGVLVSLLLPPSKQRSVEETEPISH